jgi:hypothetical protein
MWQERSEHSCLQTLTLPHAQVEELAKAKLERPKRLRQQAAREWREIDDGAPPAACAPACCLLQHAPPFCMFRCTACGTRGRLLRPLACRRRHARRMRRGGAGTLVWDRPGAEVAELRRLTPADLAAFLQARDALCKSMLGSGSWCPVSRGRHP